MHQSTILLVQETQQSHLTAFRLERVRTALMDHPCPDVQDLLGDLLTSVLDLRYSPTDQGVIQEAYAVLSDLDEALHCWGE